MLNPKYIRDHVAEIKENIRRRRMEVDADAWVRLDDKRLAALHRVEALRQERNTIAEQMKTAEASARGELVAKGKALKTEIAEAEESLESTESAWRALLLTIPNLAHPEAPVGNTEEENRVVHVSGTVTKPSFVPLSHVTLGERLDLIDFERGAKVAGAKFYFLKNELAIMEQALTHWALREISAEGFTPMITPDVAKDEIVLGAGYTPRGPETQIYSLEGTDLSLVGTAEIALGGFHRDEILDAENLPLKYVGVSHCFRTEAGAYGRESFGLYRVHQFSKVEMFIFCKPDQSDALHEELRRIEQMLFDKLGLVYRVIDICTGDLGGPAYRKYDLEAWMWGRGEGSGGWGEITSASNCTDYQARRLGVRYRQDDGELALVHTLNGTGMVLTRPLIAIMEQYQQADGTILVPEVLRELCGFERIGSVR